MNLLLNNVVNDITGKTGMSIIRAILKGQRDPVELAKYRDNRCKKSEAEIAKSLKGHYREEHVFALKQAVELYDVYDGKIRACDKALAKKLDTFDSKPDTTVDRNIAEKPAKKRKSRCAPDFDVRSELVRVTGVDLTEIDGMDGLCCV